MTTEPTPDPSAQLARLVNGYQVSQAIHVAATLGIADLLKNGPRTSDDLAQATETHPPSLYRLLRALAAVGVLHEDAGRRFALTPLGDGLRSDSPKSVRGWAAYIGREYFWRAWGHLLHSVRTGETGFSHEYDTDIWSYREEHPEESAIFDAAMTSNSSRAADAIVAAYDFSRFNRIVDVAGGQGALLASILAANPDVRGIVFDQPHVVARASATLEAAGVADRCDTAAGSFFESVPEGADAYILRAIIHDWDDASSIAILKTIRKAIPSDGTLLLIELLVGPPNESPDAKFMDLNMLVAPGGQERTREEFAALFDAAGFTLTRVVPTGSPTSLVEGVPC